MLSSFWHWFVIILVMANILACWWLLYWSGKGKMTGKDLSTGHVWDDDLEEYNNPLPRWWLIMFHLSIVFGLVYLLLFPGLGNFSGYLGWTQLKKYDAEVQAAETQLTERYADWTQLSPAQLLADADVLRSGERIFANNCAMCHGSDARGAKGYPDLTDNDWLYGDDFNAVLQSISEGRKGVMPPMGAALNETQLEQLVVYVQSLSQQKTDPGLAAAGRQHFTVCAACHGSDGSGNQALGAPNLTDNIWIYGADPEAIKVGITDGRSGNMPAHKTLLSEARQRAVAAYVLSLSDNHPSSSEVH